MRRLRTEEEIDELIALARTYCEVRASLSFAQTSGQVTAALEERVRDYLKELDRRIEFLKSNRVVLRSHAHKSRNILRLESCARKVAK